MTIWPTASLGDAAVITAGQSPRGDQILDTPATYPFHQGVRDFGRWRPTTRTYCDSPPRLAKAGDVLISVRAPIGRVNVATTTIGIGRGLMALRGGARLETNFLAYFLESLRPRWNEFESSGSVFANLGRSDLANIQIPLPAIEEQRAIAATLGALDDKIESNQRKLRLLDDLFQATWCKVSSRTTTSRRLGDIVSTQYGLTASASVETEGARFLRVTDINKANWVSWSSVPSASITETDWRKYRLSKGDLLVARMADPGKSAIYDEESVDAVFASYLVRLRAGSYAESLYLYGFLKSELYEDYAAGATTGSVQKNMNAKVIVDVDVPWPNVSEIDSFADSTAPLRAAINQLVRECDDLRTLRDALLPELLAGRLRVPESHEDSHEVSA